MNLDIRWSSRQVCRLVVACLLMGFVLLGGCEPKGHIEMKLFTSKQDFGKVSTLSFHFSGTGLKGIPKSFEVPVDDNEGKLPALVIDDQTKAPWFDARTFGLDGAGKVIAFGAVRLPLVSRSLSYDMFFTLTEKFTSLVRHERDNKAIYPFSSNGAIGHRIVALNDGRLLIVGGAKELTEDGGVIGAPLLTSMLSNLLLYDPSTGVLELGPQLGNPRAFHTASVLPDGRVVIAGGIGFTNRRLSALRSVEIFDPKFDSLVVSKPDLATARAFHTATVLSDGSILFVGGLSRTILDEKDRVGHQITMIETYTPGGKTGKVGVLPSAEGRFLHKAIAVAEDRIIIAGGVRIDSKGNQVVLKRALLLRRKNDQGSDQWTWKDILSPARYDHALVGVKVGEKRFAVAFGGRDGKNKPVLGIDVWDTNGKRSSGGSLKTGRYGLFAVSMENQKILVAGGLDSSHKPVLNGEIFSFSSSGSGLSLKLQNVQPKLYAARGRYKAAAFTMPFDPRVYVVGGGEVAGSDPTSFVVKGINTIELYTPLLNIPSDEN